MVSTPTTTSASPQEVWPGLGLCEPELPVLLRFPPDTPLSDKLLEQISRLNKPWRFERTATGDLIIMAPAGNDADEISIELGRQLLNWVRETRAGGVTTGSSGGYVRGDGHLAAPDAAWTSPQRRASLSEEQLEETFQPISPTFVIEVRSGSDTVAAQRRKMEAWVAGGAELGWLVVPENETVYVYRPGEQTQVLDRPDRLSAEPVCEGLTIDFEFVWNLNVGRMPGNAE
ncbi:MAG: Uma2 family endonuclease [Chloroflexota bacterium]|nr:Uma2 family endonuclease [Chloroflexota bacterium]MDE2894002.1 Uma2 family endonuclease [Chloroflexota bacterium]